MLKHVIIFPRVKTTTIILYIMPAWWMFPLIWKTARRIQHNHACLSLHYGTRMITDESSECLWQACARASSLPRVSLRCVCIRKRPRFRTTSSSTIMSSTVWKYHCLALWYNPYLANCGLPEAKMCFRHFSPTELFNRQHVKVHLNMQGHRWIPKDAPIKKINKSWCYLKTTMRTH